MTDSAYFDVQRHQPIELGRLASTWAEVSLHGDMDGAIGRNSLPAALWAAVDAGVLPDLDEIAVGLNDAWTGCEWPPILPRTGGRSCSISSVSLPTV